MVNHKKVNNVLGQANRYARKAFPYVKKGLQITRGVLLARKAVKSARNYVHGVPNYERKRVHRRMAGSIGSGTAWKKVKRIKATRTRPRVGYKFLKKVQAVNSYDKPYGEYIYISDQQLSQSTRDDWAEYSADNNGNYLTQFTPYQIWDAASVCFQGKPPKPNWMADIGQGVDSNIRYKQPIHVINSYTTFEFKSTSAHVVNVEMYICYPKSNFPTEYAINCALNSKNGKNNAFYGLSDTDVVTAATYNELTCNGTTSGMWQMLYREFKVTKVTMKFNPGEAKKHFLQGPKNYTVDGEKHTTAANQLNTHARFAPHVFFRVINDVTVCGVETGITRQYNCSQWFSNIQGGVAMRQRRHIRVRMPENTESSTLVEKAGEQQNTVIIGRWTKRDTTDVDQQVTVQNPLSAGSIFP